MPKTTMSSTSPSCVRPTIPVVPPAVAFPPGWARPVRPIPVRVATPIGSASANSRRTSVQTFASAAKSGQVSDAEGLAEDAAEAALERAGHGGADRALLEALDQLGHEALDHEALGELLAEAARAQVEELLGIDLGDRGGVRAAHVVGE